MPDGGSEHATVSSGTISSGTISSGTALSGTASVRAIAGPRPVAVAVIVAVATLLIGSTLALWAVWGPAVFYEVIVAGIAACF